MRNVSGSSERRRPGIASFTISRFAFYGFSIMNSRVLQIDPRDNVFVALANLNSGESVEFNGRSVTLVSDVPAKHKLATKAFAPGDQILMYGVTVGTAVKPIAAGEVVTTSNIRHQA